MTSNIGQDPNFLYGVVGRAILLIDGVHCLFDLLIIVLSDWNVVFSL